MSAMYPSGSEKYWHSRPWWHWHVSVSLVMWQPMLGDGHTGISGRLNQPYYPQSCGNTGSDSFETRQAKRGHLVRVLLAIGKVLS